MREILFRGKRTKTGEWVTGSLWHHTEKASLIYSNELDNKTWVSPKTVGQFTGMTDKNGKKIFEGDVIKRFWLGGELLYRVIYESDCARFIGECINRNGFTTIEGDGDCFEVIGNIYDNPELLEGHQ